jgi:hypothetical protein
MSFAGLLNQSLEIANKNNTPDLHGRDSFGSESTVNCRFERVYKTIVTAEREREPIHAQAMIGTGFVPTRGARVQYGGTTYRCIEIAEAPGRNGQVHHYELMLQEWDYASS